MHLETIPASPVAASSSGWGDDASAQATPARVIRRNGSLTPFDATKIAIALTKAFLAVEGSEAQASARIRTLVEELTARVVASLANRMAAERPLHIEDIQDQVELVLMRAGEHKTARAYVLYREQRAQARAKTSVASPDRLAIRVRGSDGSLEPLDLAQLGSIAAHACDGLTTVSAQDLLAEARRSLYDGMSRAEVDQALVMAARALIEREPDYSYVSARLLLRSAHQEAALAVLGSAELPADLAKFYAEYFPSYVKRGVELELLDPELARFDLPRLAAALRPDRDRQFQYLGVQTLYDRYLLHSNGTRIELPQALFMRVAMGLAVREIDRDERAIEFYELLSAFDFMCSTPTLFNAGTPRSQLSSCFLTTVPDDLDGIFKSIKDNALLSKYAGGLGNDWTRVRGLGARIKGTNGASQGVVPFLKIANDTAVAVNQGGKRKGAVCAYLETWHIDIDEFLDLRKNTGDDRRRTHDMHTANWIPDLFMRRVAADAEWTLFSPNEVPDLHDLYGPAFEQRYQEYEARADRGEVRIFRRIKAVDLWRRMLTLVFETGHPWITFKDPCNIRSPEQHAGVIHSSNLCTEITLNTSDGEVAVCNLGSVNLARHVTPEGLDTVRLQRTVRTAIRMLDNVIDINFYTIPEARRSNLRHRPIGLGLMGYQDALYQLRIPTVSSEAVQFADESMELLSYYAIEASTSLAAERGRYPAFSGSLWSRGVLPIDSVELLAEARNAGELELDRSVRLDWAALRERVTTIGMRHSNVLAIAPTATIANICGVTQSIEPTFQNLFVKSNMSGEFTVVNPHLVRDLKARALWDDIMVADLKYLDGSLGQIDRVPDDLKALYATAFEIDSRWLIEAAARRQKWIDQAQSLNLYLARASGPELDALYRLAWQRGLKTTYYLRTRAASRVEKSTLDRSDGTLNAVAAPAAAVATGVSCSLDGENCEACQ